MRPSYFTGTYRYKFRCDWKGGSPSTRCGRAAPHPQGAVPSIPLLPFGDMATGCSDTCEHSRNNVCNDGSDLVVRGAPPEGTHILSPAAASSIITCVWGTDCHDCGPHAHHRFSLSSLDCILNSSACQQNDAPGTENIMPTGMQIRAAWTATQPPFIMAFTDPKDEFGVSRSMDTGRAIEPGFALHWHRVTAAGCARGGLMLDVGSNFGYYALWAAVMGCRVIAWEPVPTFRAFLALGAQLNNVSHRIHVRASVASDASAPSVSVAVPEHGIAGTASLVTAWAANGTNVDKSIGGGSSSIVHAPAETLDTALRLHEGGAAEQAAILRERPCAMKVDVEGHEPSVLRGATRLLSHLPPRALLFEYSPGVVERARKWSLLPPYAHMLETLRTAGYRMWHLGGLGLSQRPTLPCLVHRRTARGCAWDSLPLPPLREIGERGVAAELRNAANMMAAVRDKSFNVPWDLHPHSLHAEFGHNTDVLAVHPGASGGQYMELPSAGEVGIRAESPIGLGGAICSDVMHAGSMREVMGKLCFPHDRAESIAAAAALADTRTLAAGRAFHQRSKTEAAQWRFDGPCRFGVEPAPSGGGGTTRPAPNGTTHCHLHLQFKGPLGLGVTTTPLAGRADGIVGGGALVIAVDSIAARDCPELQPHRTVVVALNGTELAQGRRLEDLVDLEAWCCELTLRSFHSPKRLEDLPQPQTDRGPSTAPNGSWTTALARKGRQRPSQRLRLPRLRRWRSRQRRRRLRVVCFRHLRRLLSSPRGSIT